MSRLEDRAAPIIEPMMLGKSATLDLDDQETVALWALKTALTFQVARPARKAVPGAVEMCRQLFERRRPPLGARVLLGAAQRTPACWEASTRADTAGGHRATSTPALLSGIVFGHLVLVTVVLDPRARLRADLARARIDAVLSAIWPADRIVVWPGPAVVDGGKLTLETLRRLLHGPERGGAP